MAALTVDEIQDLRQLNGALVDAAETWRELSETMAKALQEKLRGRPEDERIAIGRLVGMNESTLDAYLLPLDD